MKKQEFFTRLKQENKDINIEMSEELKSTNIYISESKVYNKKPNFVPKLCAVMACLLLMVFSITALLLNIDKNAGLTSYILEINPALCITTDKKDNIINVCALNEDANEIVSNSEFDYVYGIKLEECLSKIIKIVKEKGYFDNYDNTVKIYAINDDLSEEKKKLDNFAIMMRKELGNFQTRNISFEKHELALSDFRKKIGAEENFAKLDDMREYFINKDKCHVLPPVQSNSSENKNNEISF